MGRRGLKVGTCFMLVILWPILRAFQFWYAQPGRKSLGVVEKKTHNLIPGHAIVTAMRNPGRVSND